jgi:hypothetical protein
MLTKGYKMWWNYFEIAYGKEEWNEAGPVVKSSKAIGECWTSRDFLQVKYTSGFTLKADKAQ